MAINVIFNDFSYEILPKRKEVFDKYNKILQWGRKHPTRFIEDFFKIQLTDMQKYILLSSWVPKNCIWVMSRNSGKALSLDTPVYYRVTDRGNKFEKKTIGELKVGDVIYDESGNLTTVIHLNPIIFDDVYEVEFEDGEKIKCNADHLWYVHDLCFDKNKKYDDKMVIRSTDFIFNHFKDNGNRFKVPLTQPIKYPEINKLPIDPYLLGVWLGDGTSIRPEITVDGNDVDELENILREIPEIKTIKRKLQWGKENCFSLYINREKQLVEEGYYTKNNAKKVAFIEKLKKINLYNNKHIPEEYLYASVQDRLSLLQRLMDTDGSVDAQSGTCSFTQANEEMCQQVQKLLSSLGIKSTITKKQSNYIKQNGEKAVSWTVFFSTDLHMPCFRLKRKLIRLKEERTLPQKHKTIINVTKLSEKVPMRCITVSNKSGLFLCGEHYTVTHNSFLSSPFMMARAMLLPNTNTYIMAPSGGQAMGTFKKVEQTAKGQIASLIGVSSVFLDECVRQNATADPFTHNKSSNNVTLYNGSTINTLNSVAETIVGIRSNFNVYDEAGKIERSFFALTRPFTAQDTNFITGDGINVDIYPKQLPNKTLLLSSAQGVDSELYEQFQLGYKQMLLGNPNYFVCSVDYTFSLHPTMNGKPMRPLVSQEEIDNAFAVNPYKAQREYGNIFDVDGGEDTLCKHSTILKHTDQFYPVYENDGTKRYLIAYDPSSKLDNSIIGVGEIWRDEERGWMMKIVNCINLIEMLPNGEKVIIQKPKQLEILKDLLLDYNKGGVDYENIDMLIIDSGAGGGGYDLAQYLLNEWKGKDNKLHRGFIDTNDTYMSLRQDDYVGNAENLRMFNFKRDKNQAYERAQAVINQGLVRWPKSLNVRNEYELEVENPDGTMEIKYEKVTFDELNSLTQIELMKQEIVAMQKVKRPNGSVVFETSPDGKSRGVKDDRADVCAMLCDRLMELRIEDALALEEKPKEGFKEMFGRMGTHKGALASNPFANRGANPFLNKQRPN